MEGLIFQTRNAKEGYGLYSGVICGEKSDISVAGSALGENFIHFFTVQPVILMFDVRVKRGFVDGVGNHEDV